MLSKCVKAFGLSFALALCLSAADPFMGTWKLNLAKSKFEPGPAPKNVTTTYTSDGDWIVVDSIAVNSSGEARSIQYRYKRDGNEYPFKAATHEGFVAVKKLDSHTVSATIKRDGKVSSKHRIGISKDGQVRTVDESGTSIDGKPFKALAVFDKQ